MCCARFDPVARNWQAHLFSRGKPAVVPSLFLLRRTTAYPALVRLGSVALVVLALGWFVERALGLSVGVTWLLDRLLDWPRPLLLAGALAVVAVGLHLLARSSGRLVPVADGAPTDEDRPAVTTG